jgi:hypothetical protein
MTVITRLVSFFLFSASHIMLSLYNMLNLNVYGRDRVWPTVGMLKWTDVMKLDNTRRCPYKSCRTISILINSSIVEV